VSSDVEKIAKPDENTQEYGKNNPEWGRYYGENKNIDEEKFAEVEKKASDKKELDEEPLSQNEEPFMFPIDLLLWSHGGDGYNAMINTGVRVSYWNVYSVLSVGTDFSTVAARPLSLGVTAGGFYRISDFSITADLGYEKVWDFGDNAAINDYALGLRAGLSYSVLSWFAISAGAGVNYSIFKDSSFEEGKFIPMFFGGFEFSLIK
jgi:opacity protein-like surface antigen